MARSDRPRTPSPKVLDHPRTSSQRDVRVGVLARSPVGRRGSLNLGQVIDDHLRQDSTIKSNNGVFFVDVSQTPGAVAVRCNTVSSSA